MKYVKNFLWHVGCIIITPLTVVGGLTLFVVTAPLWLPIWFVIGLHDMGVELLDGAYSNRRWWKD